MEQQIIVVGDREFTFFPLRPFAAVGHLTRLKGVAMTGLNGAMTDVTKILDGLDEQTLERVVFPILKDCGVTCTTDAKRLTTPAEMDQLFTHENLDEFFEVVTKVVVFNFEPLLKKTLARFGIDLSQVRAKAATAAKAKIESQQ